MRVATRVVRLSGARANFATRAAYELENPQMPTNSTTPIVIGIIGGSGSGKTTFASCLRTGESADADE